MSQQPPSSTGDPAVPADMGSPDLVDRRAAEFLAERDRNPSTPVESWLEGLSAAEQEEFRQVIESVMLLDHVLPPRDAPPAQLAGRFRLGPRLGRGGFAQVYRAEDLALGRSVAVKILPRHQHEDWTRSGKREAQILAKVSHPNVVRIFDVGTDQGLDYLVMELLSGFTLEQVATQLVELGHPPTGRDLCRLMERRLPEAAAAEGGRACYFQLVASLFAELARALQAVHLRQVVHRDLKPANVLIRRGGSPVVLDFGLASRGDSSLVGKARRLVGTPSYLAPEQLRTHTMGRDARLDVYQLGALLYEMLTLQPAFDKSDALVFDRIRSGDFVSPRCLVADVPEALERICLQAMSVLPQRRQATMRQLAEELESAAAGPCGGRGGLLGWLGRLGGHR